MLPPGTYHSRMSSRPDIARSISPRALTQALEQNKEAADDVKAVADELAVTHAVLESTASAPPGEVAEAIARTGQAEKQLSEAARKLDQVNEVLEREASARG